MIHFEQMDHVPENRDEFGDNLGPGPLFKLQTGIIKVKLSGNNKIYAHIPYRNLSEETMILKKGRTVGSLSLVEEVTLVEEQQKSQAVKTSDIAYHINNMLLNTPKTDDKQTILILLSDMSISNHC